MAKTKEIPFAYRRDLAWDLELDETGDIHVVSDVDAINQSIYSILVSNFGDKPLEQNFGSDMEDLIFELSYPRNVLAFHIEEKLKDASRNFEPTLYILGIKTDFTDIDSHTVRVTIGYLVGDGLSTGIFDESISLEDLKR